MTCVAPEVEWRIRLHSLVAEKLQYRASWISIGKMAEKESLLNLTASLAASSTFLGKWELPVIADLFYKLPRRVQCHNKPSSSVLFTNTLHTKHFYFAPVTAIKTHNQFQDCIETARQYNVSSQRNQTEKKNLPIFGSRVNLFPKFSSNLTNQLAGCWLQALTCF